MNDVEKRLIREYLEGFELACSYDRWLFMDTITKKCFDIRGLTSHIMDVFYLTTIDKVVSDWVSMKLYEYRIKFNNFLREIKVTLGATNWILSHPDVENGMVHTYIHAKFPYNSLMVNDWFEEWYNVKIVEVSETMMKSKYIK